MFDTLNTADINMVLAEVERLRKFDPNLMFGDESRGAIHAAYSGPPFSGLRCMGIFPTDTQAKNWLQHAGSHSGWSSYFVLSVTQKSLRFEVCPRPAFRCVAERTPERKEVLLPR